MSRNVCSDGRRRWLGRLVAGGLALCGLHAATGRAADTAVPPAKSYKKSKEKVGYIDVSPTERTCGNCVLYSGNGVCVVVEGEVAVKGWCTSWAPSTFGKAGSGHRLRAAAQAGGRQAMA